MRSWLLVICGIFGCQEYGVGNEKVVPPEDGSQSQDLGPIGTAPIYAHTSTALFAVDPSNDSIELVGEFMLEETPIERFVDLAMDSDGRLFGGTYDAIYEIGATNALVRQHCATQADLTAMAFGVDGLLYIGDGSTIQAMDIQDCSSTVAFELPEFQTSGDLVGTPDGALYWSVEGDGVDELIRLDPSDSSFEWVRTLGAQRLYGLGYFEGDIYGFSSFGRVVRAPLDVTQAATVIATVDEAWWGAAANPTTW